MRNSPVSIKPLNALPEVYMAIAVDMALVTTTQLLA